MKKTDHDLVLGVVARLESGEISGHVCLTLVCDALEDDGANSRDCSWRIDVPVNEDAYGNQGLDVTFTAELMRELGASHDRFWEEAWDDDESWTFGALPIPEVPGVLVPRVKVKE